MTAEKKRRPKVAAILTVFYHRSHAHVLLENFLEPYLFNGKKTDPGVDIVSFYVDQFPKSDDMSRAVAKKYGIPIYETIDQALCLGQQEMAVDAVLLIGEHGDYPENELGQRQYPRKQFFDQIVATMRRSNRFVPLFNDKHLSYRWDWAKEMYETTQQLGIPFLAGSSVPLAQRRPALEIPAGAQFEQAVAVHGGPMEAYDFHGLELLQSMIESRKGGASGVSKIEFLDADALWKAARDGRWSVDLAAAALNAEFDGKAPSFEELSRTELENDRPSEPYGLLVTYTDGLTGVVVRIGQSSTRWNFACRLKGDPKIHATSFYTGPWRNRNLFKALAHAIQWHFTHGEAPYPIERTLLTTGTLEAAMKARVRPDKQLATPHLEFQYTAKDFLAMREMGTSWEIINEQTPEPSGVDPGPVSR